MKLNHSRSPRHSPHPHFGIFNWPNLFSWGFFNNSCSNTETWPWWWNPGWSHISMISLDVKIYIFKKISRLLLWNAILGKGIISKIQTHCGKWTPLFQIWRYFGANDCIKDKYQNFTHLSILQVQYKSHQLN